MSRPSTKLMPCAAKGKATYCKGTSLPPGTCERWLMWRQRNSSPSLAANISGNLGKLSSAKVSNQGRPTQLRQSSAAQSLRDIDTS